MYQSSATLTPNARRYMPGSESESRVSTKGQRVSTANERGRASQAAFLFSSEPPLSFHGSLIQEPLTECLEDRDAVKRSSELFPLLLPSSGSVISRARA